MGISSVSNYGDVYENPYISNNVRMETEKKKEIKADSGHKYLKKIQSQVSYVNLEVGNALNMKRDNKVGTVTMNPKLLEKMQNDPEAERKYTQLVKDIERAEKTVNAYYNSLGGCVERSSHWYIDENGKYYHFGYTRRDDKLNKKLRLERQKNTEKWIEKSREKAREKTGELAEKREEKAVKAKEEEHADLVGNNMDLTI